MKRYLPLPNPRPRPCPRAQTLAGAALLAALLWSQPLQAGIRDEFDRGGRERNITTSSKGPRVSTPGVILPGSTAPAYAISGYSAELAKLVVAQTPAGPISMLDLLMFDHMNNGVLNRLPVNILLEPASLAAEPFKLELKQGIQSLAATASLAERAGAWHGDPDQIRVMSFGAGIAAFTESRVADKVTVGPADIDRYYLAHPEIYLRRPKTQVRYIFSQADPADAQATQAAINRLEEIARRVRSGELKFDEAARENSNAPSAAEGGLLPPFLNGNYFQEFEDKAFALSQPGELSEVFRGPGGVYLIQLVQSWPPANIPIEDVKEEIRADLQHEHVRHYYIYELEQVRKKRFGRNNAGFWEYMDIAAPVAQVDNEILTRNEFLRYFPNPTDPGYGVIWVQVYSFASRWVEGETIMQELEATGGADHPYIQRARQLADMILRSKRAVTKSIPLTEVKDPKSAVQTLQSDEIFKAELRQVRMLRFELTPELEPSMAPSQQREAMNLTATVGKQLESGELPVSPSPIDLKAWYREHAQDDEAALKEAIKDITKATRDTTWSGLKLVAEDMGWQPAIPGSGWEVVLRGVKPGEVSKGQLIGTVMNRYLVLAERPIDINRLAEKPLYLQNLAWISKVVQAYRDEIGRATKTGEITYNF